MNEIVNTKIPFFVYDKYSKEAYFMVFETNTDKKNTNIARENHASKQRTSIQTSELSWTSRTALGA